MLTWCNTATESILCSFWSRRRPPLLHFCSGLWSEAPFTSSVLFQNQKVRISEPNEIQSALSLSFTEQIKCPCFIRAVGCFPTGKQDLCIKHIYTNDADSKCCRAINNIRWDHQRTDIEAHNTWQITSPKASSLVWRSAKEEALLISAGSKLIQPWSRLGMQDKLPWWHPVRRDSQL